MGAIEVRGTRDMRGMLTVALVVLLGLAPLASAQTAFPGTPVLPGMSAPVAFPVSPDPGGQAWYPFHLSTVVPPAPSNLPSSSDVRHGIDRCHPLTHIDTESITVSHFGVPRRNWFLQEPSHDANVRVDATTWRWPFMTASSLTPKRQPESWFNAPPSALCLPD
jgi:hypothetical protein